MAPRIVNFSVAGPEQDFFFELGEGVKVFLVAIEFSSLIIR